MMRHLLKIMTPSERYERLHQTFKRDILKFVPADL